MFCCRGTKAAVAGLPRCGTAPWCGEELGCGDRDCCACGSYVASERRCSVGTGTGEGDEPDGAAGCEAEEGAPPDRKKACRSIFFSVAVASGAGTEPNALGAPLSSAGGAAGEDESLAFLSPALPNETVEHTTTVSTQRLALGLRLGIRDAPSEAAAPRTSSTRAGGTRTPSTCTLGLFWTGLVGCEPEAVAAAGPAAAAAAATAAAFGMVGL